MQQQLSIIITFILINTVVGRLFQESLGTVCFSELAIIGISGFFFWYFSSKKIAVWSRKWHFNGTTKNFLVHGGLGLSVALINVLIAQLVVIVLMSSIYNCVTPTSNFLNASLTNNIAVNFLCYFSLILYFIYSDKLANFSASPKVHMANEEVNISVTRAGFTFLLSPADVSHIEAANNCIILHTNKGKFAKYQSLKSIQHELPSYFKRVHRSRLVNCSYIESIKRNKNGDGNLLLSTGEALRFSRYYHKELAQI